GVGVARIDIARLVAGEARIGLFGSLVDEALGQVERLGRLAELRAVDAAADQLGRRFPVLRLAGVRHGGAPFRGRMKVTGRRSGQGQYCYETCQGRWTDSGVAR